jgi:hypothetical protein
MGALTDGACSNSSTTMIMHTVTRHPGPILPTPRCMQAPFLARWDLVTSVCLLFTATVTPLEVAFLNTSFNALYFINRVVDVVFIVVRA